MTSAAVGCGDISLDVAANRGVDRREVERSLTTALELGLSTLDVRPEPDTERLVGDLVRSLRLRDRATTIVRVPALAGRDTPIDRLPSKYIQERVESALRHTKLDALPVVLLGVRPAWTQSKAWAEVVGTISRLVREGKVLAWGADIADVDSSIAVPQREDEEPRDVVEPFRALLAEPWLVAIALTFSALARGARPLIDAALVPPIVGPVAPPPATGTSSLILSPFEINAPAPKTAAPAPGRELAVLARHPLAGGALAGTLGPGRKLSPRDDRDLDPTMLDRLAFLAARLSPLVRTLPPAATSTEVGRSFTQKHPRREDAAAATLTELALRYVVDTGAIALPRLHRNETVIESFMAVTAPPLPESNTAILDSILLDT